MRVVFQKNSSAHEPGAAGGATLWSECLGVLRNMQRISPRFEYFSENFWAHTVNGDFDAHCKRGSSGRRVFHLRSAICIAVL